MTGMDNDHSRALLHWLVSVDLPELVVLGCDHTRLPAIPGNAIGVHYSGCLADAPLSLPAQLLALGVPEIGVVSCPTNREALAQNLATWQRTLDGVRALTEPATHRFSRRRGPVLTMGSQLVSRRLALGLRPTNDAPFDLALDEPGRGLAALRILEHQGRAHLESVHPSDPQSSASRPIAVALRAEGCTACGVCVRACPHHALHLSHEDGVSVLFHRGDACRAEQACVRLCPVSALLVTGGLDLAELTERSMVELARVPTRTCPRCRAQHPAADGELCGPCRFRVANAFGSRPPQSAPRD